MMPDHYATLGVEPTATPAAIRAAYLGLMREYHPDRNPSGEATLRAQTIIGAFKVLGDFDRRSHYDWDRRREREAAAAAAAKRPRAARSRAVAAGAIVLAAAGAWALMPTPAPEPRVADVPVAEARQAKPPAARPAAAPKRVAAAEPVKAKVEPPVAPATTEPRNQPARVAKAEPLPKPKAVERPPPVRMAAVKAPAPRVVPPAPQPPPVPTPRRAQAAAKPAQAAAKPATDLASLDQFVMNFYGQSWRYGDGAKRAALVQSRNKFLVRRGECAADQCKRAAYLRLMREVSEIVEAGQPKPR